MEEHSFAKINGDCSPALTLVRQVRQFHDATCLAAAIPTAIWPKVAQLGTKSGAFGILAVLHRGIA